MMTLKPIEGPVEPVSAPLPVPHHWYMLRVMPTREVKVHEKLEARGVTVYLPTEMTRRRASFNRKRECRVAIFYGTMFVPDYEADLRRLKSYADGIMGYQRWGAEAIKVRPKFMEEIRAFETKLDLPPSERKKAFAVGQGVRVVDGPFAWFGGNIERLDSEGRLKVLVNIFGRMTSVELDEDQVEAV